MEEQNEPVKRNEAGPTLIILKVLCIFTFIGSGLGFLSYGIIGLMTDYFSHNLNLVPEEQNRELIKLLLSGGQVFLLLNAALYAVSFVGALKLWRMQKIGFHLYTASQLLLLILPLAMVKGFPMTGVSIFLSLVFVWGYSGFLKFMK